MDTDQFIASLVSSLAWPVTVGVIVFLLRRPLAALLAGPVKRLKAGPVELEFDRIASAVEARIEPIKPQTFQMRLRESAAAKPAPAEAAPESAPDSALSDLSVLAHERPEAAVLGAFSRVEADLRQRLRVAGNPAAELRYGGPLLARAAAEAGIITPTTAEAVEGIAVMRTLAAHGVGEISETRALEYLALVDGVSFAIARDARGHESD